MEGGVDEIDAEGAEGALLFEVGVVGEADVEEDIVGWSQRGRLEPDSHPAVAFRVGAVIVGAGADRIAEGEERSGGASLGAEAFHEDVEFVGEHGLEAFAGDITRAGAVDGVAHGHVVGRHRFGDGARGSAHFEEPCGGFLAGSDFREGAVFRVIEIEL